MSVNNAPSVVLSTKDHRHPQFILRTLSLTSYAGLHEFLLHEIRKVVSNVAAKFLPIAFAVDVFWAHPVQSRCDIIPA